MAQNGGILGVRKPPKSPKLREISGIFAHFCPPGNFRGNSRKMAKNGHFGPKMAKDPHFGPKGRKRAFSPIRPLLQVRKSISGELSVSTQGILKILN